MSIPGFTYFKALVTILDMLQKSTGMFRTSRCTKSSLRRRNQYCEIPLDVPLYVQRSPPDVPLYVQRSPPDVSTKYIHTLGFLIYFRPAPLGNLRRGFGDKIRCVTNSKMVNIEVCLFRTHLLTGICDCVCQWRMTHFCSSHGIWRQKVVGLVMATSDKVGNASPEVPHLSHIRNCR